MPIIIEELITEIQSVGSVNADAQAPRPAETKQAQATFDLLELAREREARLAHD